MYFMYMYIHCENLVNMYLVYGTCIFIYSGFRLQIYIIIIIIIIIGRCKFMNILFLLRTLLFFLLAVVVGVVY